MEHKLVTLTYAHVVGRSRSVGPGQKAMLVPLTACRLASMSPTFTRYGGPTRQRHGSLACPSHREQERPTLTRSRLLAVRVPTEVGIQPR